jgi:hypothetical protein
MTTASTATATPISVTAWAVPRRPDPRRTLLQRASARLALVEAGEMDLGLAFGGLVSALDAVDTVRRWERDYPPVAKRRRPTR